MWLRLLLISALAVVWSPIVSAAPDKILCYHGTWSHWRTGNGQFSVSNIDTNLCTHIIYSFVGINSNGTIRTNSDDFDYPGFFNLYKQLKNERTPKPKLILAIGGWNEGSVTFSQVAANANLRKKLLESAIKLIQTYGFDGFDFDWEYPTDRGGSYADKSNFVTLLSEFRTEFNKYGYLLTAAVSVNTGYYDVPGIAKSLDLIHVMTYDFAGTWNGATGHHSSYPDSINSINAWKNAGAPYNKLVLGIGTYGRSFTLSNSNNNGIGAGISGGGTAGPYTGESGILGYNEICEKLKSGALTRKWSNDLQVPYAVGGNQWVGYDDPESIAIKGKFVVANNLAGIMIWSVETDDFRGTCGSKYPLLTAIKNALNGLPPPTQPPPGTTTSGTIICYHGTWSYWRSGNERFTIPDIDTNLCTFIIYLCVGINGDGTIRFNSDDLDYPGFLNLYKQLKNDRTPKPKLLVSIGGWNEGSVTFSQVAANANLRKKLLESAIKLIQTYNFDGFDFDWEYPTDRGGVPADRSNFVTLLSEFRAEFNKYGYILIVTVSVYTGYYDVPGIAKNSDLISLKTFDYNNTWNREITHHSSYSDSTTSINAWKNAGAPANKLILGISAHGHVWNINNNGNSTPICGGLYGSESGTLAYYKICEKLQSGICVPYCSAELSDPFALCGNELIAFDNPDSIAKKGKYVVSNNFAGMAIWTVEEDDFRGICGPKYPLLNAMKNALNGLPPTTPKPTQPPIETTVSPICKAEGYIGDSSDCTKYYYCQWNGSSYIIHSFQCVSGLYYDTKTGVCNWRDQVSCS